MPTWSDIRRELVKSIAAKGELPRFDNIRRKYLATLAEYTQRDIILYASRWTQPANNNSPNNIISDEDIQGFMEVIHGLKRSKLDLILHSPGGSPEIAEALVQYLRSKFDHIRVIVPHSAMSAATMIACAGDEILMGKHSFLGPIDPQISIDTPLGPRWEPAQTILDQFEQAKEECSDPAKMAAWHPMLNQFGPGLLIRCKHASELSKSLVQSWLEQYMFKARRDRKKHAKSIANWLCDHSHFKTHGRRISRNQIKDRGMEVKYLEENQTEQDHVLSVFHSTTHTFDGTSVVKIIENHAGRAFIIYSS